MMAPFSYSVPVSHDFVRVMHNTRNMKQKLLNLIQPSFILLFKPVLLLLSHLLCVPE